MVERKVEWKYLIAALLVTSVLFVGIFMVGTELSQYKIQDLQSEISNLQIEQQSTVLTYLLAENMETGSRCAAQSILAEQNMDDLYEVRKKLEQHRNSRKIEDPRYRNLKSRYILTLIENYLRRQSLESDCTNQTVEVLYFHRDSCDSCSGQGRVLTDLRHEYSDRLLVYPIDSDYSLEPVRFLEKYYGVQRFPTIVMEGEKFEGYTSRKRLEERLKNLFRSRNSTLNSTGSR
ncbi:MAG: thioredoxin family protein [Candidatus Nanohaloarchaea archaeon]